MDTLSLQPFHGSHARWRAVTQRDPSAHCSFLYGVTSTKIYCRPTCTARVARRANVVFYDTVDQAQLDGLRPCLKCKPDDQQFMGEREEVVVKALALLRLRNDSMSMQGGLKQLAKDVGVTPSYLCRVFKKTMGMTLGQYVKEFETQPFESKDFSSDSSTNELGGLVTFRSMSQSVTPTLTTASTPESTSLAQPSNAVHPYGGEQDLDMAFCISQDDGPQSGGFPMSSPSSRTDITFTIPPVTGTDAFTIASAEAESCIFDPGLEPMSTETSANNLNVPMFLLPARPSHHEMPLGSSHETQLESYMDPKEMDWPYD